MVYAAAAAQAGCAFVAAGRDAALCVPGIPALFTEQQLPVAGAGLLGPEALLRETLAQLLALEGMSSSGIASLSTRQEDVRERPWSGPDRITEMGLGTGWAGGAFELSFELRGQIALHLAARALDAALLTDLAMRARRSGAQDWMDALFAAASGGAPAIWGSRRLPGGVALTARGAGGFRAARAPAFCPSIGALDGIDPLKIRYSPSRRRATWRIATQPRHSLRPRNCCARR